MSTASSTQVPVTFSSFLISLASSAMFHLGEAPDPTTGETSVNLSLARSTIDLIAMLEAKTVGNLDEEEGKLITTPLGELRQKYVTKSNG